MNKLDKVTREELIKEIQSQVLVKHSSLDEAMGAIKRLVDKLDRYTMTERAKIRDNFIGRFCNDHNEKIRWLRGIAFTKQSFLDDILDYFDEEIIKKGE